MNAYEKGRSAYKLGHNRAANPFSPNLESASHQDWIAGFTDQLHGLPMTAAPLAATSHPTPAERDNQAEANRSAWNIKAAIGSISGAAKAGVSAWCQGDARSVPMLFDDPKFRFEWLGGYDLAQSADLPRSEKIIVLDGERPFSMADFLDAVAHVARERGL